MWKKSRHTVLGATIDAAAGSLIGKATCLGTLWRFLKVSGYMVWTNPQARDFTSNFLWGTADFIDQQTERFGLPVCQGRVEEPLPIKLLI